MASIETTIRVERNNQPEATQTAAYSTFEYLTTEELEKLGLGAPTVTVSDSGGDPTKEIVVRWNYPQTEFEARFPTATAQKLALSGLMAGRLSVGIPCNVISEAVTITP